MKISSDPLRTASCRLLSETLSISSPIPTDPESGCSVSFPHPISLAVLGGLVALAFACLVLLFLTFPRRRPLTWRRYEGETAHKRSQGGNHGFTYSLLMDLVDIRDPPSAGRILSFEWRDHSFQSASEVERFVLSELGFSPGQIFILTELRFGGHCFNSISVYLVSRRQRPEGEEEEQGSRACGESGTGRGRLEEEEVSNRKRKESFPDSFQNGALLLEVWNIPWFENVLYCLPLENGLVRKGADRQAKRMFVSPFNPLRGQHYKFRADVRKFRPGETGSTIALSVTLCNDCEDSQETERIQEGTDAEGERVMELECRKKVQERRRPPEDTKEKLQSCQSALTDREEQPSKAKGVEAENRPPVVTASLLVREVPGDPPVFRLWPTLRNVGLIMFEAFRLLLKGVRLFDHQPKEESLGRALCGCLTTSQRKKAWAGHCSRA